MIHAGELQFISSKIMTAINIHYEWISSQIGDQSPTSEQKGRGTEWQLLANDQGILRILQSFIEKST